MFFLTIWTNICIKLCNLMLTGWSKKRHLLYFGTDITYGTSPIIDRRMGPNLFWISTQFQSIFMYNGHTLYNTILRIARNFLDTRENIKILTHPFYHINLGCFSWEWSKFFFSFFRKKNSKWPTQKKLIFQNRQFSKFFRENFSDSSLG